MRGGVFFFFISLSMAGNLSSQELYVGSITVHCVNVFDVSQPEENKPPYTWVNKLHLTTREKVIRREMLLSPGDPFQPYLVEQTERNLRAYKFIKDSSIATRRQGNIVHLDVYTQDTWTTDISPSFGRSGGETNYGALLRERNFLGRGKTVELSYDDEFNGVGRTILYQDPRLGRSRWVLNLAHTDYSDGFDGRAQLELPLYSLLAPYYAHFSARHYSLPQILYKEGEEVGRFQRNERAYEVYGGRSLLATTRHAIRSAVGARAQEQIYTTTSPPRGLAMPENRDRLQLTWTANYAQSDYVAEAFVNQFERVEDFNLGWEATLGAAYGNRSLGSDKEEYSPLAGLRKGFRLGEGHFMILQGDMMLDWVKNRGVTQMLRSWNINYTLKNFLHRKNTLIAHAEASQGLRLHPDTQLVLGGNSGLRGYRLNAFSGTRSALFNLENRWHAVIDFLKVVSIAPVAFWDAGYVWPRGDRINLRDLKHDLGFGVRVGFTRSATAPVLRMDLSYALSGDGAPGSRWVFSFNTSQAFGSRGNALPASLRPED